MPSTRSPIRQSPLGFRPTLLLAAANRNLARALARSTAARSIAGLVLAGIGFFAAAAVSGMDTKALSGDERAPGFTCYSVFEIPFAECEALVGLFNDTGGTTWTDSTDWLVTNTPCSWFGVTCSSNRVTAIDLPANNLAGTLPRLSDLANLDRLDVSQNALSGIMFGTGGPPLLTNLDLSGNRFSSLPAGFCLLPLTTLSVTHNKLPPSPLGVLCLDALDPGWQNTQTVPPDNITMVPDSSNPSSVVVSWTPIAYTGDTGGYRVSWATQAGGPFTISGQTADKTVSSFTVAGLPTGNTLYFRVDTFTDAHASNPNDLVAPGTVVQMPPSANLTATINQIDPVRSIFLQAVNFYGTSTIGIPIMEYKWTYQEIDDQNNLIGTPVQIAATPGFSTNIIPQGRHQIVFQVTDNNSNAAQDVQEIVVGEDRTFTDLEVRGSEITFLDAGINPFNPITKVLAPNDPIKIRFRVHNLSAVTEHSQVRVKLYDGDPDNGGTEICPPNQPPNRCFVEITEISAEGFAEETIDWNVGSREGYRVITVRAAYAANEDPTHPLYLPPTHPEYPKFPEVTLGNNEGTAFLIVGTPDPGTYEIDLENVRLDNSGLTFNTSNPPDKAYAGIPTPLTGHAVYSWGNRLPVMGAKVELAITKTTPAVVITPAPSRTTAPFGAFFETITFPEAGTYQVQVKVIDVDNVLFGIERFAVEVMDPPPWPNLFLLNHPYRCDQHAVQFTGVDGTGPNPNPTPMVWREGCNFYTVQAPATGGEYVKIQAKVENTGFADAVQNAYEVEVWKGAPDTGSRLAVLNPPDIKAPGNLGAGEVAYELVMTTWEPTVLGSHLFCMRAKVFGDELTTADNVDCQRIHVLKRAPDLYPTNIRTRVIAPTTPAPVSPWPVLDLETIEIQVDVVNLTPIAPKAGDVFDIELYSGNPAEAGSLHLGTHTFTITGSDLQNRGSRITIPPMAITWKPDPAAGSDHGWQPLWAVVDREVNPNDAIEGQIDEAREGNNRNWRWICVFKPGDSELRPFDILFSNYAPTVGMPINVFPRVQNKGELDHPAGAIIEVYLGHPDSAGNVPFDSNCQVPQAVENRRQRIRNCTVTNWVTPMTPGTVYVYARYTSPGGTVWTWGRALVIYADPPPDLQVLPEDIDVPAVIQPGQVIPFAATIRNVSTMTAADGFSVQFLADTPGGLVDFGRENMLGPLAATTPSDTIQVTAPIQVKATQPFYAFLVEVIPNPLEGDANRRDNAATTGIADVTVKRPPLLHYPMEEASWGAVRNATQNAFDGAASGDTQPICSAPAFSRTHINNTCRHGTFNTSANSNFDGTVVIDHDPRFNLLTDELTVMAWALQTPEITLPKLGDVVARGQRDLNGELTSGFALGIYQASQIFQWRFTLFAAPVGKCEVSVNFSGPQQWTSVAGVFDGNDIHIVRDFVLNGVMMQEQKTEQCSGTIDWGADAPIEISPEKRPFRGLIDEVRIYDVNPDIDDLTMISRSTRLCGCDNVTPPIRNARTGVEYQVDPLLPPEEQPFHPIQRALDEALPGDTLTLRDGTWEPIDTIRLRSGVELIGGFDGAWSAQPGLGTTINGSAGDFRCIEAIGVDANTRLTNVTVESCTTVNQCGAGFYGENAALTIDSVMFQDNRSGTAGGGLCLMNAQGAKLVDTIVRNNEAASLGGGLEVEGGSVRLRGVTVEANKAGIDGGGLFVDSTGRVSAANSRFLDNEAINGGGAVYLGDGARADLFNVALGKNVANTGAALEAHAFCGQLDLDSATIYGNDNLDPSGKPVLDLGIACPVVNTGRAAIRHGIVWNLADPELDGTDPRWRISYSNVEGGAPGLSNINLPPVSLVSPNFFLAPGDPNLDEGSHDAEALGLGALQGYRTDAAGLADGSVLDLGFHHPDVAPLDPWLQTWLSLDVHTWRSGGVVRDLGGEHHHGIRTPGTSPLFTDPALGDRSRGTCGYADFASPGAEIRVPPCQDLEITDALTVSAWVRPGLGSQSASLLRHGDSASGWELALESGDWVFKVWTAQGEERVSAATGSVAGQWSFVTGVFDGTDLKIYVDSATPTATAPVGNAPATILWQPTGRHDLVLAANGDFVGALDEVKIFAGAFADADVAAERMVDHGCGTMIFSSNFESGSVSDWSATVGYP